MALDLVPRINQWQLTITYREPIAGGLKQPAIS